VHGLDWREVARVVAPVAIARGREDLRAPVLEEKIKARAICHAVAPIPHRLSRAAR
jgi:hypothetical protein